MVTEDAAVAVCPIPAKIARPKLGMIITPQILKYFKSSAVKDAKQVNLILYLLGQRDKETWTYFLVFDDLLC